MERDWRAWRSCKQYSLLINNLQIDVILSDNIYLYFFIPLKMNSHLCANFLDTAARLVQQTKLNASVSWKINRSWDKVYHLEKIYSTCIYYKKCSWVWNINVSCMTKHKWHVWKYNVTNLLRSRSPAAGWGPGKVLRMTGKHKTVREHETPLWSKYLINERQPSTITASIKLLWAQILLLSHC